MLDMERYVSLARQAVAEGCVLLKNDAQALPIKQDCKVASFGRSQFNYYKSGTGSGGKVNTAYVVSVLEALRDCKNIIMNETVLSLYEKWIEDHPFDGGNGWATEPWCQEEMPLSEEVVKEAALESEMALVTIARLSGEAKDNSATEGCFLLTKEEEHMLEVVCRNFAKTVVLLNTGNIIDMKWVEKYNPSAVLYIWQGGQEGGNGVLDVLTGKVSPCGKLTDTIAKDYLDYPSATNFGDDDQNIFTEDIYIGYRYFETFAKDKVLYPFGYGLSYTKFDLETIDFCWDGEQVAVSVKVTNCGNVGGKEVVQLYKEAPQGALGKPVRELCGFAKTRELLPGESETVTITCNRYYLASYDDSGVTGHLSAYVLEAGEYHFYAGTDVRSASRVGMFEIEETLVVEQHTAALSPTVSFDRMYPKMTEDGFVPSYQPVPTRNYDLWERIVSARPSEIPYTGDQGYKLVDVRDGKVSMQEFVAQMTKEDISVLLRGEGMCSLKVTPGTGGAFGGLTKRLKEFGIPVACCTDGPSGLRMDVGTIAFSLPNGTCLASSYNEALSEELFEMLGIELRKNKVDILLGPGMNLHRNPLNGRNFEYFSEDPIVTGKMTCAQLRGMHKHNVTGTIKHFIAQNQEYRRTFVNGVISERAIRELYLKGFEIAVKEGGAYSIMSTYGPINGLYTASNYDLLTQILRKEWGYKGFVMSDWWSKGNEEGCEGSKQEMAAMVRSQNDIYMVANNSEKNSNNDNMLQALETDRLTIGEMQRCACNLLRTLMRIPAMARMLGEEEECYRELCGQGNGYEPLEHYTYVDLTQANEIPTELISTGAGCNTGFELELPDSLNRIVELTLRARAAADQVAQIPMFVYYNGVMAQSISLTGADKEWQTISFPITGLHMVGTSMEFRFAADGIELGKCKLTEAE
jgi:beta-glucosidase